METVLEPGYLRSDAWYVSNYTKVPDFRKLASNQLIISFRNQTWIQPESFSIKLESNLNHVSIQPDRPTVQPERDFVQPSEFRSVKPNAKTSHDNLKVGLTGSQIQKSVQRRKVGVQVRRRMVLRAPVPRGRRLRRTLSSRLRHGAGSTLGTCTSTARWCRFHWFWIDSWKNVAKRIYFNLAASKLMSC